MYVNKLIYYNTINNIIYLDKNKLYFTIFYCKI